MTAQGIAAQGVFMEEVPNTFLRVAPFFLVCLGSNSNEAYNGHAYCVVCMH